MLKKKTVQQLNNAQQQAAEAGVMKATYPDCSFKPNTWTCCPATK